MKRSIKRLTNWFVQWVGQMYWNEKVSFALGAVLGIILGITEFVSIDKVPATSMDYEPLKKQAIAVQQNPELLLEIDCDIDINDGVITVNFENDNCKVIAEYNKSFEMIKSSKEDKSTFWLGVFCRALLLGIGTYALVAAVLSLLLILLEPLWENIKLKLNKTRLKKQ